MEIMPSCQLVRFGRAVVFSTSATATQGGCYHGNFIGDADRV
jgi:hypothetical protein